MQLLNERENKILDILVENPQTGIVEIGKKLSVSAVTIRSDFDSLSDKGYIVRTRGGGAPAFHPAIIARQRRGANTKTAIARKAATLINEGDAIMIEAGTTTAMLGRFLMGKQHLRVVTDSTLFLPYARRYPAVHFTFVGGTFYAEAEAMIGPMAVNHISQFHAATAFIGCDGLSLENGLTTHMMEAADVVRVMHERSDKTVLLADSGKWDTAGFARIIPLEDIDILVSDWNMSSQAVKEIESRGVKVILAPKKE